MTLIQPGWLGVPAVIIVVVATALVVTGVVYGLVPPARRFIKGERPVWWVRDGFLAVFVAVLVLFGHSYVLKASDTGEHGQAQDQDQRMISDLDFVRFKSSEQYQARPFRGFDLRGMNLAGLELKGANFSEANLSGANLTGTVLREQTSQPSDPQASRAMLVGVNLCNAVLTGADLRYSYLINANLTGADLNFVQLQSAALNGADLTGAKLSSELSYLAGIYYDETTIWPEGFQPPPSATGSRLDFLDDPLNNELYGDLRRPACNS